METKINIAAILKDKPKGTKLYSTIHGKCSFEDVTDEIFKINFCTSKFGLTQTGECTLIKFGNMFDNGECVIFPSKEMRDWSKFAWKKGDVLIKTNSEYCIGIFDEWTSDDYSTFSAKYINLGLSDNFSCSYICKTEEWEKTENSKNYISKIERVMNGKLNLKTLEVEKQPEFKDGDVLFVKCKDNAFIELFNCFKNNGDLCDYVSLDTTTHELDISGEYKIFKENIMEIRLATEEEKLQLFNAILAKKGKTWDVEKKMIVDLKPKYEFKPMDLCLMKYIGQYNNRGWELCQYAYTEHRVSSSGEQRDFYHAVGGEIYAECIPYKGNEHLLGTKKSK